MLENKNILVSGGTGAIGKSICLKSANYGANVAFTFLSKQEEAEELSSNIKKLGRQCYKACVDARNKEAIEQFCKQVEDLFGHIDILVNNLGATQVMPFALIEEDDWDDMMQINLKSMFLFSKAVVRGMIRRKKGVILNLGSIAGHRLVEVPVHYATAKAGVSGFTTSLAKELSRYGIRVNEVCPGLIDGGIGTNVSERQMKTYNEFCSLNRPGTPDEVAEMVTFLASDRSSYINAQRMVIDGGL